MTLEQLFADLTAVKSSFTSGDYVALAKGIAAVILDAADLSSVFLAGPETAEASAKCVACCGEIHAELAKPRAFGDGTLAKALIEILPSILAFITSLLKPAA